MRYLLKITSLTPIIITSFFCFLCFYNLQKIVAEENSLEKIKIESNSENLNRSDTNDSSLKLKEKNLDKRLETDAQTGFIFIPKEIELIASMVLTVFSIMVALFSLIGKDDDSGEFFVDFPLSRRLDKDKLSGRLLIPILNKINITNSIMFTILFCFFSPMSIFFGYVFFRNSPTLSVFALIAEVLLTFLVLLFFNVLLRGVLYYLSIARSHLYSQKFS